jgi:riboflavin-specific deaminase-like protein
MATDPPRPFIWLNAAVSLDGRLAYADGRRAVLSGPEDLRRVQDLRRTLDAILVGSGTVLADDPSLRVHWERVVEDPPLRGTQPTRVVLDARGRIPLTARVLDGSLPTLVFTGRDSQGRYPAEVAVVREGVGRTPIEQVLSALWSRGIRTVLLEGGSEVLTTFLRGGWVDRFTLYQAPVLIGEGSSPPLLGPPPASGAEGTIGLNFEGSALLEGGHLLWGTPTRIRPGAPAPPRLEPTGFLPPKGPPPQP